MHKSQIHRFTIQGFLNQNFPNTPTARNKHAVHTLNGITQYLKELLLTKASSAKLYRISDISKFNDLGSKFPATPIESQENH